MKYIFVLFNFLTPRSVKKLLASHIHTQHNTIQYNYFLDSPGGMLCCSVEPFMFFVWRCDCVQCTVHVNLILKWLFRGTIHIGSDKADSCSIAFIFKTQNENKIGFAFLNTTAVQSTAVQWKKNLPSEYMCNIYKQFDLCIVTWKLIYRKSINWPKHFRSDSESVNRWRLGAESRRLWLNVNMIQGHLAYIRCSIHPVIYGISIVRNEAGTLLFVKYFLIDRAIYIE